MKLKHMLYLLLLCFSLVPLYVLGLFMIYANNKQIEDVVRENLAAISGAQILDIQTFCESRKEQMQMVSEYDIIKDAILSGLNEGREEKRENLENVQQYLENMLVERRYYNQFVESISVVDREFKVVASSEEYTLYERSDLADTNEKYLTGEFFIGNVYQRQIGEDVINVVPAYIGIKNNDELIGYLVEEISTDYFDRNRLNTNLINSGTLYILDEKKQVITAGSSGDKREEFVTTVEERADFQNKWEAIDHNANPSGEVRYTVKGNEYITYYSDVDYTEWIIQVTVNLSSYNDSSSAYKAMILIAIFFTSLVFAIGNLVLSKRIAMPINNIAKVLGRVQSEQNYSLRIHSKRKDEMGFLSDRVNDLLDYAEKASQNEKKRALELEKKAQWDQMTGVRNKENIEKLLKQKVERAIEAGERITIGFLDIDDFRDFNTMYGHQEGDKIIQYVASVLQEELDDNVGRNGGDEFIFSVEGIYGKEEIAAKIKNILEKLNKGMVSKLTTNRIPVPCSIGIVSEKGENLYYNVLVRKADEAMYIAKENGKNTFYIDYIEA